MKTISRCGAHGTIAMFLLFTFYSLLITGNADAARASFAGAERAFLEGRYDSAIGEADMMLRSGSGRKDELYYLKGLCQLKTQRFEDARTSFDYIISKYSWSKRLFDAYMGRGDSYLLQGNAGSALGVFNGMQTRFQWDRNLVMVYQRLAACYGKLGLPDKARFYADKAKGLSPLSFEAGAVPRMSMKEAVTKTPAGISPAPDTAAAKAARAARDEGFSVQVGVFKNKRNADKLVRKLADAGYDARVEIPVSARDKLYRVKVGSPASKAEAGELSIRLARDGYKTKISTGEPRD